MKIYDENRILRWVRKGKQRYPIIKKCEDVTSQWKKNRAPVSGEVICSNITITQNNGKFHENDTGVIFGKTMNQEERKIANWFKNNIYGNIVEQRSIKLPKGIKSPDLALTQRFFLLKEQTVEIKEVSADHTSVNTLFNRVKAGENQSSNILIDVTNYKFKESIESQVYKCYKELEWLDVLLIKDGDELASVYKKA